MKTAIFFFIIEVSEINAFSFYASPSYCNMILTYLLCMRSISNSLGQCTTNFKKPFGKRLRVSLSEPGVVKSKIKVCLQHSFHLTSLHWVNNRLQHHRKSESGDEDIPKPILGWGIVPLNLLLTRESIPFCLRHDDLPIRKNCWCWWRSKDLVLFLTIFALLRGVIFVMINKYYALLWCRQAAMMFITVAYHSLPKKPSHPFLIFDFTATQNKNWILDRREQGSRISCRCRITGDLTGVVSRTKL